MPSFFNLQSMLLVEENDVGVLTSTHADIRWCTRRKIGPVVVVYEPGRHAMEVADRSKIEGIIVMPTLVLDPPEARGVEAALEIGKESSPRKATRRPSARKRRPILINPDRAKRNMGIGNGHTMPRDLKESEMDRAQPL